MNTKYIRVAFFLLVALASLGAILFAEDLDGLRSIAQIPFVVGAVGALFQLVRDDAAHFRAQQLQDAKQGFALGVESHMSKVAFDKHVAFCEEYGAEIHRTFQLLNETGPSAPGLACAARLFAIRVKHSVWLPDDMEEKLKPFEDTVREIETSTNLARSLRGELDRRATRDEANMNAARALRIATGEAEWQGEVLPREGSYKSAHDALRVVIGSEFLMRMRDRIRVLHAAGGL